MKIFLLFTKPKIDFFFQIPVQFGRRAKRGGPEILDISEVVDPGRIELPFAQCECAVLPLNYRPVAARDDCLRQSR